MKTVGLVVVSILIVAFIMWASLLATRICWDYTTDNMLLGMQEAGLVADEIGWVDAFILLLFGSILARGSISLIGASKIFALPCLSQKRRKT